MVDTRHNWQTLEMLTVFNLKFQVCACCRKLPKKKVQLPTPMQFIVQKAVGETSDVLVEGCMCNVDGIGTQSSSC